MDTHIYRCAACGGMNRVPTSRLNQAPNCGRCKKRLALENAPFDVDDAGLATLVAKSPVPVLVDFWARRSWHVGVVAHGPAHCARCYAPRSYALSTTAQTAVLASSARKPEHQ